MASSERSKDRDLFAIRHLLALRERIAPFGITRGPAVRRRLNWTAARGALADFNEKHARRRSKAVHRGAAKGGGSGGLSRFAVVRARLAAFVRDGGVPRVTTVQSPDARKDLEKDVKLACARYVDALHRDLVGPLDAVVAEAKALCPGVDEVRADRLSPAQLTELKGVEVAQFDHVAETLRRTRRSATAILEGLDAHLALYLENPTTRKVLVKPAKDRAAKSLADYKAFAHALFSAKPLGDVVDGGPPPPGAAGDDDDRRMEALKPHFDVLANALSTTT
mmetsp:Transcript_17346/g.69723  ORF Transcript_17346/g.69723 Transcript_17346/m.69723 type:complete len:279 (-) Transcript_17346:245-1081(-)